MSSASMAYFLASEQKRAASTTSPSAFSTPKYSFESSSSASIIVGSKPSKQSRAKKAMKAIVRHAKEHHESVNAAYNAFYGAGLPRQKKC
ncbi:hypothetical protein AOQ84DRAFT_354150 [Glonium stellatum]|uniref:Uncharacterized protein n=1 Tax=Glonium stellatum TaxID=574774 RepID=A0A8E2F3A7_9PEZI|nr:hypothetical protein AOQ84DRAFT_354150 [Glonium stellatum]